MKINFPDCNFYELKKFLKNSQSSFFKIFFEIEFLDFFEPFTSFSEMFQAKSNIRKIIKELTCRKGSWKHLEV